MVSSGESVRRFVNVYLDRMGAARQKYVEQILPEKKSLRAEVCKARKGIKWYNQ